MNSERAPGQTRIDPKTLARIAGVLYLILAICSGFGFYERSRLIETGDAATTAAHVRSSAALFRAAFVADLVGTTAFLLTAMVLYVLLHHVDRLIAAAMVIFVAVSVAIQCANLLNQLTTLSIATGDSYAATLGPAGRDLQVMLFADRLQDGFFIAQVFFGAWLVPLGYLAIKSGFFPRALGVLLMLACLTYQIDAFAHFTAHGFEKAINPLTGTLEAVAELAFVGWLLLKGVRQTSQPLHVVAAADVVAPSASLAEAERTHEPSL